MSSARFSVNGSPSSARGYIATPSEVLTIQLEDLPATDIYKVRFDIVAKDRAAETLTIVQPSPPTAPIQITMPSGSAARTWLLRCQINDGKRTLPALAGGKARVIYPPEWTQVRALVVLSTQGAWKIAPTETTEHTFPEGWVEAVNKLVDLGAAGGVPANITNNVSITGPGAIAIAPAAGSNLALTTTAAGGAILSSTGSPPTQIAGAVQLKGSVGFVGIGGYLSLATGIAARTDVGAGSARIEGARIQLQTNEGLFLGQIQSSGTYFGHRLGIGPGMRVRVIATANHDLLNAVVDGVTCAAGDYALFAGQTTPSQNGLRYRSSAGAWNRASDFAVAATMPPETFVVAYDGTHKGEVWRFTTATAVIIGTDAQAWALYAPGGGGGGSYTFANGSGLDESAGAVTVDLTDTGKFTDVGVPSRALVLDGSSRVIASGLRRTGGTLTIETVTSGALSVTSAGATSVSSASGAALSLQQTGGGGFFVDTGGHVSVETTGSNIDVSSAGSLNLAGDSIGLAGGNSERLSFSGGDISLYTTSAGAALELYGGGLTGAVLVGNALVSAAANSWGWHFDSTGGAFRARAYEPTSGALCETDTYDAAGCTRAVVGTFTMTSGGAMTLGGAGVTALQPTTNANAALLAQDASAYWWAQNNLIAGFVNGNCAITASGNISLDNGGAYAIRGPGPWTASTAGNDRRWRFEWPLDVAINTATTTVGATFQPIARPATFRIHAKLFDAATGATSSWVVDVEAVLFGGVALLSNAPPTGASPTRTIGSPVAATLTVAASGAVVEVRFITTNTTPQIGSVTNIELL